MSDRRPLRFPSLRLVALAALAGIAAGALAVYVRGMPSGNGPEPAASADCAPAKARAAGLKPLAKGDVAAFSVSDDPKPLAPLLFKAGVEGAGQKSLSLADFAGKTVLVNLWATWCVPCREEMPALDQLQAAEGGANFEVVAINIDNGDDQKPQAFLAETGIQSLAYYRDNSLGVFNQLKKEGLAFGLPVTLLVDGKGCLLGSMNGPAHWAGADARALVAAAKP